ncbi:hypothetical protein GJW-30_1_02129 [Variibacter gotjawalensis]|uniref:DUF2188 domain-containing protein n=1 Tax=Variibacter gotjawalensis TaxID=1333996 RepID=A0A0S3PUP0_9BRAD|nr:hypothetical protein [Variibacter gotjawalensis]NIK49922.1 hypothetical protein [Variibacter gotjawalensis]RZS45921.1 hypothetical protein EV661_4247 [Variibacter gotjawalensis]BAT59596.1 hypothetical protein GJW-30_1_02129 [Variibacter gotjawalensis]
MQHVRFEVARHVEGWGIKRGAEIAGSYPSKEAALEAAKMVASGYLGRGMQVTISMPSMVACD